MTPTLEKMIELREKQGLTREEIAEHYGVSVTVVRRWIKDLGVPRRTRKTKTRRHKHLSSSGEIIAKPDSGLTTLDRAKIKLKERLVERRGYGYYLDGRPVSIFTVLQAVEMSDK